LGRVESLFGNLESNKGLNWFTLQGKSKINAKWLMCCTLRKLRHRDNKGIEQITINRMRWWAVDAGGDFKMSNPTGSFSIKIS